MFFRTHYDVLLVDDEPDVLTVSSLALKQVRYHGVPLRVNAFASKAEAIAFLEHLADPTSVAVAIVDVVMESDLAGLELCNHIRGVMRNDVTQLLIRTGQPGSYPQQHVAEAYEINGYMTKAEATAERLYTLIVNALRQYEWTLTSVFLYRFFSALLPGFRSPHEVLNGLRAVIDQVGGAAMGLEFHGRFCVDQTHLAFGDLIDAQQWEQTCAALRSATMRVIDSGGDGVAVVPTEGGHSDVLLVLGEPKERRRLLPSISVTARVTAPPADFVIETWRKALHALRRFLMIARFVERGVRTTAEM